MRALLLEKKGALVVYVLACLLFVVSDMVQIGVTSWLFDALESGDTKYFLFVAMMVVGGMILNGGLYLASRMLRLGYMKEILLTIRMRAFEAVMKKSYKQFGQVSREVYLSRLTNDINSIESRFFTGLVQIIANGGLFVVGVVAIAILDLPLAVGTLSVAIGCYVLSSLFLKKTEKLQEAVSEENEQFTLEVGNTFNGLEIIKLSNMEKKFSLKNIYAMKRLERSKWQLNNYTDLQRNGLIFIGYVAMVGIVFYLGIQIQGGMGLGKAVFLYDMSSRLSFLMMNTMPLFNVIKASSKLYDKITHEEDVVQDAEAKGAFTFEKQIEARNLSFGYEGQKLLNHTFFTIQKGKKYLIKGVSGAGKSTVMKLLGMVYDNYEGDLVVDGVSYKAIDEKHFNQKVAFIEQDVFLFEDTLKNNMTLYKEVDEMRLAQAIQRAGLTEVVEEKGLEMMLLENGKNLSGGQRQRLAIARALAKEAEILFVDEGTSSLNEELGRQIEKDLLALPQTVIAISHRYYKGVSEDYDYVLEIQGRGIRQYEAQAYFEGVMVC
ncbi:MAG: ATP-binding cassette domain-containing protein [Cellulosilyticaceae bacterium]